MAAPAIQIILEDIAREIGHIADSTIPRDTATDRLVRNLFDMRSNFLTPVPPPNTPPGVGPGFFGPP